MDEGYSLAELARLGGVTKRVIRLWVSRGLIARPAFRSTKTRYSRTDLLRVCAIGRLRREEHIQLDAIAKRLSAMSPAELEAMMPAPPASAQVATAAAMAPPAQPAHESQEHGERWERIVLIPGLELHLRGDATPLLRRLAREIREQYAGA